MGLSVNAHPDAWMDGVAVAGQDLRLQNASAFLTGVSPSGTTGIAARPGVRYGTGSPLLVQASSGMNITVNAGVAWVQGTVSATAGMYTCCLDTTSTLTVATSDPTNPRIDNVICQITDVGTSSSTTVVTLQTGTPAPSPVAPPLPANSLLLATIAVGAGVSSITSANITDARVFTGATGGVTPVANTSGGISGAAGMYVHNLATGRMQVSDGSGNARAPKTAAITPVTSTPNSLSVNNSSGTITLASVSVTTDGSTELELTAQFRSINPTSPAVGDDLLFGISLDGTAVANWFYRIDSTSTSIGSGATYREWTTPSSGTHTITFTVSSSGSGSSSYLIGVARIRVGASFS